MATKLLVVKGNQLEHVSLIPMTGVMYHGIIVSQTALIAACRSSKGTQAPAHKS
jgi:ABC-type enterochelin transport system permease subunit